MAAGTSLQLPGGFFTEFGIMPIGPLAEGLARGAGRRQGVPTSPSPGRAMASAELHQAAADFEKPPSQLSLPKEVDLLVSLLQVCTCMHLPAPAPVPVAVPATIPATYSSRH